MEDLFVDRLNKPEQPIQLVKSADRGICRVVVCKLRGRLLAYPLAGEHSFRNSLRSADGLLDPDGGKV
ncbi:MAG: hypothetical protein WAM73_02085 [Desulfobacterales bacterium]